MNVRRGLLLAGIHLAVSGSLILWQESRNWPNLHSYAIPQHTATFRLAAWQEDEAVVFDPCNGGFVDYSVSPREQVARFANLPVAKISGWGLPCPAPWTLVGVLNARLGINTRRTEVSVAAGLGALIALQWFLIGGFPLIHPRQWWWEPGAFITVVTAAAFVLVVVPGIRETVPFLMLFAALAWLDWFGLVAWRSFRAGWLPAMQRFAHSH